LPDAAQKGGSAVPIKEIETEVTREYPREDSGDYLIRDREFGDRPAKSQAFGIVAAGSGLKTIGGIAVAALAILALVGVIPAILMPIAGIVFGVAMLLEGFSITGEYRKLARWLVDTKSERIELAGGSAVELAVGAAGIVLGILALLSVVPAVLIPVLIVAGGAGLMLAVGAVHRLNDLQLMSVGASDFGRRLRSETMAGAAMVEAMAGLGALVLGILSLVLGSAALAPGFGSLAQIGMICLGVGAAIGGGAIAGRSTMLYRRVEG
jgi:hypothetical protein